MFKKLVLVTRKTRLKELVERSTRGHRPSSTSSTRAGILSTTSARTILTASSL